MIPPGARVAEYVMKKNLPDFFGKKNNKQPLEIHAGIQPFKLVKYFSYTSLVVILVASFLLSLVISNNAKKVLLDRSESYSELFAENLSRQVFLRFVLPTAIQYGGIALSNQTQFERLDQVVRNVTKGMGIDSVTIFDSNENIISYSTILQLVGKADKGGFEYRKALEGESNSVLISSASMINLLPGAAPVYCKLLLKWSMTFPKIWRLSYSSREGSSSCP